MKELESILKYEIQLEVKRNAILIIQATCRKHKYVLF